MKIISLRAAAEAAAVDRACPAGAFTPEVIASVGPSSQDSVCLL